MFRSGYADGYCKKSEEHGSEVVDSGDTRQIVGRAEIVSATVPSSTLLEPCTWCSHYANTPWVLVALSLSGVSLCARLISTLRSD
eukprot:scaffold33427_cov18-Prasinocladus_malaysianus.AAC.3